MSTHDKCGATITWARRPDDMDRYLPPLEFAGTGYIIDQGVGVQTQVFKEHHCDPEAMIRWAEYKAKIAEIEERKPDFQDVHEQAAVERAARKARIEELIEEEWEWALKIECKKCGAQVKEKCANLTERSKGNWVPTKHPHPTRADESGWTKHIVERRKKELDL